MKYIERERDKPISTMLLLFKYLLTTSFGIFVYKCQINMWFWDVTGILTWNIQESSYLDTPLM